MSQSLQDEYTIDATAELRLVAPEPYCEINVLVDKASFGEATRDDPCQSEENVELTLSPVLGRTISSNPACVAVSGGVTAKWTVHHRNVTSLVTTIAPTSYLTQSGAGSALGYEYAWATSLDQNSYTTISGLEHTTDEEGFNSSGNWYYQLGGSVTVPPITDSEQYGVYSSQYTTENPADIQVHVTCM